MYSIGYKCFCKCLWKAHSGGTSGHEPQRNQNKNITDIHQLIPTSPFAD